MAIQIGDTVNYAREGYHFERGAVLTTDEIKRGALVQWTDEHGWTHQRFCGAEFLTKTLASSVEVSVS